MNYDILKQDLCCRWLSQQSQHPADIHNALHEIAFKVFKIIPWRKIHQCLSLKSALFLLEKWRLLSSTRLEIIVELSDLLKGPTESIKIELRKINPNYDTSSPCLCHVSNISLSQSRDVENTFSSLNINGPLTPSLYTEVYEYLSENIGSKKWIDLGRKLPGMRNRTEDLRADCSIPRQKDKIIMLLEDFDARCSEENALTVLLNGLEQCELIRQRDEIKGKFAHLL